MQWNFAEGALGGIERAAVQAHLGRCGACRAEAALCQKAVQALIASPSEIPPAGDLRAEFYLRLAAERRRPGMGRSQVALGALAAGLIAIAFVRPAPVSHPARSPADTAQTRLPAPGLLRATRSGERRETGSSPFLNGMKSARYSAVRPLPSAGYAGIERRLRRFAVRPGTVVAMHESAAQPRFRGHTFGRIRLSAVRPGVIVAANSAQAAPRGVLNSRAPETLAKAEAAKFLGGAPAASEETYAVRLERDRAAIDAAAMPADSGVSLVVTDQVRGFNNTTRVASEVEISGTTSTIHMVADDN